MLKLNEQRNKNIQLYFILIHEVIYVHIRTTVNNTVYCFCNYWWLNPEILSFELEFNNFNVSRYDRCSLTSSLNRHGGVLIAVRTLIKSFPIHVDTVHVEQLFVVLSIGSFKLLINIS
jgi:hypothetical protein